jgi:hypothetical protein
MFSATKFQLDYYIDIIFPFAAIICARYINNFDISRPLFAAQMGLIFLLSLIAVVLSVYVMNLTLLGTMAAILIGLIFYLYITRSMPFNFRTIIYSVFAINLLYIFLTLMTALTFTQYGLAHNAANIFNKQPDMPIYIYQMPEVARELALYSKAPCYAIETVEPLMANNGNYYLLVRHDHAQQLHFESPRFRQLANREMVVHKTGTFNKLLKLAKGTGPLESIDFLQAAVP